jgi:hypothetical protein
VESERRLREHGVAIDLLVANLGHLGILDRRALWPDRLPDRSGVGFAIGGADATGPECLNPAGRCGVIACVATDSPAA